MCWPVTPMVPVPSGTMLAGLSGLLALLPGKSTPGQLPSLGWGKGIYNLTYVWYILCGIPSVIIHMACRMQGFYVAKGNSKSIKTWQDLTRPDVVLINREKGCGTRVLLDEQIR